ncbi:hypothetical protein [Streptococcus macacae]|uniref:Uncharacterized protein n=1 Tax=Streptococcus macacae NCTC 11558 TaxID=764298 RepID=G5JY60_9STRE|nr:hypothetical protein [Streptococcus macacae]EHJ52146.1 hypothetical protein STRMA_0120 [Streptococcus macacae NCTC 11558]SUN77975.1 hypothetical cytosolic protein [Streptococcus macacae NCTC 11558]
MSRERKFPLVADEDIVIESPVMMHLYENEDLITNIDGPYEDKIYNDLTRDYQIISDDPNPKQRYSRQKANRQAEKTDAELAREQARQDLKRKRQAIVTNDYGRRIARANDKKLESKQESSSKHKSELGRFSDHLHQDSYILAEMTQNYSEPKNPSRKKPKKNNYDFLKNSQIYNKKETQERRERQVAQELNLERFKDVN